jgi:hypothetical protein
MPSSIATSTELLGDGTTDRLASSRRIFFQSVPHLHVIRITSTLFHDNAKSPSSHSRSASFAAQDQPHALRSRARSTCNLKNATKRWPKWPIRILPHIDADMPAAYLRARLHTQRRGTNVDLLTVADWGSFAAFIAFCATGFVPVRQQVRQSPSQN